MQTELPLRKPPLTLPGVGLHSRPGEMWTILVDAYPMEVNLTSLETVAFTKVTNRISHPLKTRCRPLGWDIKNRLEHTRFNGKPVTRSWYRIIREAERHADAH